VESVERGVGLRRVPADQQLERRLGALEGETLGLELLDELRELAWVDDPLELISRLSRRDAGIGAPTQLRSDQPAAVADGGRLDVRVRPPDLCDRRAVDAA